MKRIAAILLTLSLLTSSAPVQAHSQSILLVEVQTGSATSSSEEFVELYNPSPNEIDITGWKLQYRAATSTSWQTKAVLSGHIGGRSRFLVATANYSDAGSVMGSGLAGTGGHIRLITNGDAETPVDLLGWGTAVEPEGAAAEAPESGKSLKRHVSEDGEFIDSDDNANDWFVSSEPTPEHNVFVPEPEPEPEPEETVEPPEEPDPEPVPQETATMNILITELLIDPASPLVDSEDEYIELFNPNATPADLSGYELQTGVDYKYRYEIVDVVLAPGEYRAIYASDSNLTLSNTEGRARLLSPDGTVISETETYSGAKAGYVWTLKDGVWQWSVEATPNQANIVKAAAAKTKAAAKPKAASTKKAKAAKAKSSKAKANGERNVFEDPEEIIKEPISKAVLAGVGSLAVLYACYEYRHDGLNRLRQLKRYITDRGSSGSST